MSSRNGSRANPVVHQVAPRRWLPSFLALALAWGCSFAFVKVGLHALSPVQVAFWRLLLGALTLLVCTAATGTRLPRARSTWQHLLVLAVLLNAAPFTLFALGQQTVPSVVAAIINAATPLATLVVILVAFSEERPTRQRVVGLLVGFVGILVVLGTWRGFAAGEWTGVLACLGAIACYGVAFPYSRRHLRNASEGALALACGQVSLAAVLMAPMLLATGARPVGQVTGGVLAAMLALGAIGSGLAYVWNFQVVSRAGATTASSVTYLTPLVAAIVGVTLLGEDLTWNQPVGAIIVLSGVAMTQLRRPGVRLPHRR